MIQCDNVRMVCDNITNQVCGQNHKASGMKGWDPSQNHGRESAKMGLILTHPTVTSESSDTFTQC